MALANSTSRTDQRVVQPSDPRDQHNRRPRDCACVYDTGMMCYQSGERGSVCLCDAWCDKHLQHGLQGIKALHMISQPPAQ
jgi:hypothetical protein